MVAHRAVGSRNLGRAAIRATKALAPGETQEVGQWQAHALLQSLLEVASDAPGYEPLALTVQHLAQALVDAFPRWYAGHLSLGASALAVVTAGDDDDDDDDGGNEAEGGDEAADDKARQQDALVANGIRALRRSLDLATSDQERAEASALLAELLLATDDRAVEEAAKLLAFAHAQDDTLVKEELLALLDQLK